MDKTQLEMKLASALNALNGDVGGAGEFASRIGKPRLILSSVVSAVASWASSPSGPSEQSIAAILNSIAGHSSVCEAE